MTTEERAREIAEFVYGLGPFEMAPLLAESLTRAEERGAKRERERLRAILAKLEAKDHVEALSQQLADLAKDHEA